MGRFSSKGARVGAQQYLTTGEAAELLNISRSTVSRRFDLGVLRGRVHPITGKRMIDRDSLLDFVKQHDLPVDMPAAAGKSILLASGDSRLVAGVKRIVSDDNRLCCQQTHSGADTLIACSGDAPDLLVLGQDFDDLGTEQVIRSIRRQTQWQAMKILACVRDRNPQACVEWGATAALSQDEWTDHDHLRLLLHKLAGLPDVQDTDAETFEHCRRHTRYPVNLPARAGIYRLNAPRHHIWGTTVVRNVSEGGAYLAPLTLEEDRLPAESFRMLLEIDEAPLKNWKAYCQVIRLQANGSLRAGVQFVKLSPTDREKIGKLALSA